ncbi:MAG: DUF3623 domain-containing protein [Chloroflexi bacterium]|nr:DUF3623 domain-containing protein [Chloroflexota bacterium]
MQPLTFLIPVLYAIFLWWFTTGVIIVVFGRGPLVKRIYYALATLALLIALAGLFVTRDRTDVHAVYIAVTCGVVIWGWQLAGYYLGFVTGPHRDHQVDDGARSLWDRFGLALRAGIHHELLALGFGALLTIIVWGQANHWGLLMYVALWLMHASAKLNVFFGVRNFRIDFLPGHLHHLEALLNKRDHNEFFPLAMVAATSAVVVLVYHAIMPSGSDAQTVGSLLIATMMALGILEHALLILPVPLMLWGWGARPLPPSNDQTVSKQEING